MNDEWQVQKWNSVRTTSDITRKRYVTAWNKEESWRCLAPLPPKTKEKAGTVCALYHVYTTLPETRGKAGTVGPSTTLPAAPILAKRLETRGVQYLS
jgi:hypothetical protein